MKKMRFIGRQVVINKKIYAKGAIIEARHIPKAFLSSFEEVDEPIEEVAETPKEQELSQFVRASATPQANFKIVASDKKGFFDIVNLSTGLFVNDEPMRKQAAANFLGEMESNEGSGQE